MKTAVSMLVPVFLIVAAVRGFAEAGDETADVLFLHGNIYTVNPQQPRAEAIAVRQDKIVFVGSDADALKYQTKSTRIVDFGGKTVVPGLTDSHCHLSGVGARETALNLEGTTSLEDFLGKVK